MAWLLAVGVVGVSAEAQAYDVLAEPCEEMPYRCAAAPITFDAKDALPIEWSFDTGWVPQGSPLQVHLEAFVAANTRVALAGQLVTRWPHPSLPSTLLLTTPGAEGGGLLSYHYGLYVNAEGKFDISVGPIDYTWQGNLPFIPQIDFQVVDEVHFDAWGWPPGASVSSSTDTVTLAQVNIAALLGADIPGIEGGFELNIALDVDANWVAKRVVVETSDGEPVSGGDVTGPNDITFADYLGGAYTELAVHPEGTVSYDGVVHLIPAFYISLLGNDWSIPIADIPIPFPITDVDWVFEPQLVHVPLPDLKVEDEVVDFGEVTVGDESVRSYSMANLGEAVVAAVMSVTDPDSFPLWDESLIIASEDASQASVRFTPKAPGPFEATLIIDSNDPDEPQQTILLRGIGVEGPAAPTSEQGLGARSEDDGGCGCRTAGGSSRTSPAWWSLALALALVRRRVRRRR